MRTQVLAVMIALVVGLGCGFLARSVIAPESPARWPFGALEPTCTMDAMQCPNGTFVGRTGSECQFECPEVTSVTVSPEVAASIAALADRIVLTTPLPGSVITSPLEVSGQARGNWFFEASFPVMLTNWDGLIIAEGIATASGDWMTEDFVPFTATLTFVSPLEATAPTFMERGSLILKRDNPSGLPEFDAALEIPVQFSPQMTTQGE
jgi:hypothetical protein